MTTRSPLASVARVTSPAAGGAAARDEPEGPISSRATEASSHMAAGGRSIAVTLTMTFDASDVTGECLPLLEALGGRRRARHRRRPHQSPPAADETEHDQGEAEGTDHGGPRGQVERGRGHHAEHADAGAERPA